MQAVARSADASSLEGASTKALHTPRTVSLGVGLNFSVCERAHSFRHPLYPLPDQDSPLTHVEARQGSLSATTSPDRSAIDTDWPGPLIAPTPSAPLLPEPSTLPSHFPLASTTNVLPDLVRPTSPISRSTRRAARPPVVPASVHVPAPRGSAAAALLSPVVNVRNSVLAAPPFTLHPRAPRPTLRRTRPRPAAFFTRTHNARSPAPPCPASSLAGPACRNQPRSPKTPPPCARRLLPACTQGYPARPQCLRRTRRTRGSGSQRPMTTGRSRCAYGMSSCHHPSSLPLHPSLALASAGTSPRR